jgi:hypothetical protein
LKLIPQVSAQSHIRSRVIWSSSLSLSFSIILPAEV